jgi:hypothetical protein
MLEIEAVLSFPRTLEVLSLLSFHCSMAVIGVVGCKLPVYIPSQNSIDHQNETLKLGIRWKCDAVHHGFGACKENPFSPICTYSNRDILAIKCEFLS